MGFKVYLASAFRYKTECEYYHALLVNHEYEVPDVWWHMDFKELPVGDPEWYQLPEVHAIAERHWRNIRASDALVLVGPGNPPGSSPGRFQGANVELGYALALNIPCLSVGCIERSAMYVPVIKTTAGFHLLEELQKLRQSR